jgi:hypothetical protein
MGKETSWDMLPLFNPYKWDYVTARYDCNGCGESAPWAPLISHKPGCLVAVQAGSRNRTPVTKPISEAIKEIVDAWAGAIPEFRETMWYRFTNDLAVELTKLFNDRTPIPPVHRPITYYCTGDGTQYCNGCGAYRTKVFQFSCTSFPHKPGCGVEIEEREDAERSPA